VTIVVKIGTSSLTDASGAIKSEAIEKLCLEIAKARDQFERIILVSSGAIGAGLPALGYSGIRPSDPRILQAASAVGQPRLMATYSEEFSKYNIEVAQLLMAPDDFFTRKRYLHARATVEELLSAGILPIVNENDAIADDAIRWGDNDRIAALLAQLLNAEHLIMLTDTDGLYSHDPHAETSKKANLIHEIKFQEELDAQVGDSSSTQGSGGMASKLAAAQMASWAGVTTTIASATREKVVIDALSKEEKVGTTIHPHPKPLSARKLWIAFALIPKGKLIIDEGAEVALVKDGGSLLSVGVVKSIGDFLRNDAVDIENQQGETIGRGLSAVTSTELNFAFGNSSNVPSNRSANEIIHRDDLVLLKS